LIGGIEGTDVQTGASGSGVLAVDAAGNAYLASVTDDANFPITPGTLSNSVPGYPYNSTFVLKADSEGALAYTIIPGTAQQNITIYLNNVFIPAGISVDGNGQVTIAGTSGPGLPSTSGVIQPTFPNNLNTQNASAGFLLQLNAKASAINYATCAHAHWPPSPRVLSFPGHQGHRRTSPLPRDAPVDALAVLPCRYPQKQFVGSPDDNHTLQ
jgi:hypothetical protein